MNQIQTFTNNDIGSIRTVDVNGTTMFVACDITAILGYSNGRKAVTDHVDDRDKGVTICDTPGGKQNLTVINESGLYALVLSSNLPKAKELQHWVTSEVLPSIHRTGAYMTNDILEKAISDPDFTINLLLNLKQERQRRIEQEEKVQQQRLLLEAQKDDVEFSQTFAQCHGSILVGEMAKMLKQKGINTLTIDGEQKTMGQNNLYEWLRQEHYLGSCGEYYNVPNQRYMDQGLFEIKKGIHSENNIMVQTSTTKITAKGIQYFLRKFPQKQSTNT